MLIYSNYMVHDTVKNWQIWRKIIENGGGWKMGVDGKDSFKLLDGML